MLCTPPHYWKHYTQWRSFNNYHVCNQESKCL